MPRKPCLDGLENFTPCVAKMSEKQKSIIYFVKYPEPRKVKTRLAKTVGFEKAARIYRGLAEANLRVLASTLTEGIRILIAFDPPEREIAFKKWLSSAHHYFPQRGEDLGSRLKNAFAYAFETFGGDVIVAGSDTLGLRKDLILSAFNLLVKNTVVLGPAKDGGYYLVGLSAAAPNLFRDIPWSSSQVMECTLQRVREQSLAYALLTELEDLDEYEQKISNTIGDMHEWRRTHETTSR